MSMIDYDDLNKMLLFFYKHKDSDPIFVKGTILALLSLPSSNRYVDDLAHLLIYERQIEAILGYFEILGLIQSYYPFTIRRKWHKITEQGIRFYQRGGFKYDFKYNLAC